MEYRTMTNSLISRLSNAFRPSGKSGDPVLKNARGTCIKLGLAAAVLFALAYTVETKAIFALESSHGPFEVGVDRGQSVYP
jgi:hypothetical protein